ncbi:MAG: transglycosylase domain-containing protein, partial [Desulfobia sp.]
MLLVVAAYLGLVVFSAGSKIDKEGIQDILSRQSPVYYNDGETVMGVFFRGSHRFYVPYDRLPEDFINAIVATEDKKFFSHPGIDLSGIIRAFIANIKAGRIVQGGSTITQQTAKNLFKRQGRSLQAKLRELLYALRLEHHYTKEDILTFYANQFYVSGNGRGIGIAARYFFDKEVDDLTLVECAFIAGSVKGPSHYNPFTKSDPAEKELARERAEERTAYVLRRMHDLEMIDSKTYHQALNKPVSFNKGQMRYPLNTVMDMVEEDLSVDAIQQALEDHGIDNVATSGINVITTIDRKIQNTAVQSLRSTLSRLDIRLSGYERKEIQDRYAGLALENRSSPEKGDFLLGRVTGINKGDEPIVEVHLDREREKNGATGIIREEGLRPALTALVRYERQRWSEPGKDDRPLLLDQIREGDLIYISVKGRNDKTGEYELALEKYPELQGGALVVQDGMIKGVIGGYDNLHYNRVVKAKRPMGSTFKAPLYAAALQLGWNSLDLLDNRRRGFVYHDKPYVPQPDHYSPYEKISMAWAGVKSENVASVWLLYHLCDRLTPAQFKDLLANLGLAREKDESYQQYKRRVRDKMGIVVDDQALERTAFVAALSNCRADLAFAGRDDDLPVLQRFVYGDQFTDPVEEDTEEREMEITKEISGYNFERFQDLRDRLLGLKVLLEDSEGIPVHNLYIRFSGSGIPSEREYRRAVRNADYAFALEKPGDNWRRVRRHEFLEFLSELDKTE